MIGNNLTKQSTVDKNTELLLHIFFLQRDHNIGFRSNQLVGVLYSVMCELKYKGINHDYSYTFKRWGQNPTSTEMMEVIKSLVNGKYLEQGRNLKNESTYKLGVKGAIAGNKMAPLDSIMQNCLMAWVGYYLPIGGAQLDLVLHDKFKSQGSEIGDSLPLQNPFTQKSSSTDFDDDWI